MWLGKEGSWHSAEVGPLNGWKVFCWRPMSQPMSWLLLINITEAKLTQRWHTYPPGRTYVDNRQHVQPFYSVPSSLVAKCGKLLQQENKQFISVSFRQKLYFTRCSLSLISEFFSFFPADPDIWNDLSELGLLTPRILTSWPVLLPLQCSHKRYQLVIIKQAELGLWCYLFIKMKNVNKLFKTIKFNT